MNSDTSDLDETDETLIANDLSDEALEAAANGHGSNNLGVLQQLLDLLAASSWRTAREQQGGSLAPSASLTLR